MSIIYIHRNLINGKVYIGQTKTTINRRSRKDGSGYKHCHYFYNAIQKYGWNNFSHAILEECDADEADNKEKYWINFFQSFNRDFGYNIMEGGKTAKDSQYYTKGVYCKETGEYFNSLSDAAEWAGLKRTSMNDITKQIEGARLSAGRHPETNIPLHWCLNKENLSTPNKIRSSHNAKAVVNITTGDVYTSIREASKISTFSYPSIKKSCDSKGTIPVRKNKQDFFWSYYEDCNN